MKLLALALLGLACASPSAAPGPSSGGFDEHFTGRTMRFDYHHAGSATEEHVALAGYRLEGEWPGSRVHLVDGTNLGKYLFKVVDPRTHAVIWSRGFASIYGEWETTGEAKRIWRTFHESQRFPEPRHPVQLTLSKRRDDGTFGEIYSAVVDPASRFVDRSAITPVGEVFTVLENGPAATKVDLLVLGEGYTAEQGDKFRTDVGRMMDAFWSGEPLASRKGDFNVRAIHVPSAEAGISNPRKGVWRDSPLGLSFNAFDSDRYVLTYANETMREVSAQAPYDTVIVLFNERKYGGGGIFNLYATVSSDSSESGYVFVHEFGHSFAGLADEYYSSSVSYEDFNPPGVEPWEANVTALLDPENLKWRDLVDASTPLPTPWDKERYDAADLEYQAKRRELREAGASEAAAEALFDEIRAVSEPMLKAEPHFGKVGAFEGAGYEPVGLYRPEVDCIMFTRNPKSFCRVCSRALGQVIDMYAE